MTYFPALAAALHVPHPLNYPWIALATDSEQWR